MAGETLLEVQDLNLHYGASHTLRGISFPLRRGTVTCLLGRNGVGKTSTLRALSGHQPISGGKIVLGGKEIQGMPAWRRARAGIALVPQGREIFPRLTVQENLETGISALGKDQQKLVPEDVYSTFPVLKDMANRRGGDLSGGQQQQLAIGRAMVMQPDVLLLDEPTEGIQPNIVKLIGEVIRRIADGGKIAVLLVEQYLDFALELGDHFLIMDRGRIVLEGAKGQIDEEEARRLITV